jgi:hypothetical protein
LIHIGEKQFGEVEQEKVQRTELPKIWLKRDLKQEEWKQEHHRRWSFFGLF